MFLFLFLYFVLTASAEENVNPDPMEKEDSTGATRRFDLPTGKDSSVSVSGKSFPLKEVDDCNKTSSIGFKLFLDEYIPCEDSSVRINPTAEKFLEDHLHECTTEGLSRLGIKKKIKRIVIASQGAQYKRKVRGRSTRWSSHSTGAAIDINYLEVEFTNGTNGIFGTAPVDFEGKTREGFQRCKKKCGGKRYTLTGPALFYESFYNCINEKVEATKAAGENCSGGVLGCNFNSKHDNHIHINVPICPAPKGVAKK